MSVNELDSNKLYKFLLETFSKLLDEGDIPNKELALFIMSVLSSNLELYTNLFLKAIKTAKIKVKFNFIKLI